jgi:UDP-N-acetylglucosamine acyltransferase
VIDPRAAVDPGAELAPDVEVAPFAVIEAGVVVGAGCRIGAHAVLCRGTRMGRDNVVHMTAVLGNEPQDLAYRGAPTFLSIGDRNVFREGCNVHRGTAAGSTTTIGDDCYFMSNSHIGHNSSLADGVILATGATLAGHVSVGAGAFVSGLAVVHQHTRVGRLAMMQGGCAASRDVPPFLTAVRSHNVLNGVNVVGLRRAGFERAQIAALRRAYRVLFARRVNLRAARDRLIELEAPRGGITPEVAELLEFIAQTKRGVCFGVRKSAAVRGESADEDANDA